MPISSHWHGRKALQFRLRLHRKLIERAARRSPAAFRRELRVDAETPATLAALLQPWQERDFGALDPVWRELAGQIIPPVEKGDWLRANTSPPVKIGIPARCLSPFSTPRVLRRAWIERPRGHAKTSDIAVQILWILLHASSAVTGLAAAADLDQASLIREAMQRFVRLNPRLCGGLVFHQRDVTNPRTGSRLTIIPADVQSSWGLLPDFVICDELCHWDQPQFWQSLLSSAVKKPRGLLIVLTNAGVGRGWQWEVREAARTSPLWHFSSLAGCQAPWITPENLAEQRRLLPPPVFARLWLNEWQEAGGEFVTLAEAEACRDPSLSPRERGERQWSYVAAIDYAEKHDDMAAVIVHHEGPRIIVDRLDVARPTPGHPVPVRWVEDWIERTAARFPHIQFVLDEYQLLSVIQQLSARHDIRRFEFLSGKGNHALAVLLRKLIVHRELAWFPGCGAVSTPHGRNDLETELASLVLKQSSSGRVRIDHLRDQTHHDDRSFALGAACLYAVREEAGAEWMEVTGEF